MYHSMVSYCQSTSLSICDCKCHLTQSCDPCSQPCSCHCIYLHMPCKSSSSFGVSRWPLDVISQLWRRMKCTSAARLSGKSSRMLLAPSRRWAEKMKSMK